MCGEVGGWVGGVESVDGEVGGWVERGWVGRQEGRTCTDMARSFMQRKERMCRVTAAGSRASQLLLLLLSTVGVVGKGLLLLLPSSSSSSSCRLRCWRRDAAACCGSSRASSGVALMVAVPPVGLCVVCVVWVVGGWVGWGWVYKTPAVWPPPHAAVQS